jgi:alkylhydroperoxidase family enzyme
LVEEQVCAIEDGYEDSELPPRYRAALALTDAIIGDPRTLSAEARAELRTRFSEPEIAELALGVGLFLSMSKVLITLGFEPETMSTTVVPTPGLSPAARARRP